MTIRRKSSSAKDAFDANVTVATMPVDETTLPAFIREHPEKFAFYRDEAGGIA